MHHSVNPSIDPAIILSHPVIIQSSFHSLHSFIHSFISFIHFIHSLIHPPPMKVETRIKCFYYSHGESVYIMYLCWWWTVIWLTFTVSVVLGELQSRPSSTHKRWPPLGLLSLQMVGHLAVHFYSMQVGTSLDPHLKRHCHPNKDQRKISTLASIKTWIIFYQILLTTNLLVTKS